MGATDNTGYQAFSDETGYAGHNTGQNAGQNVEIIQGDIFKSEDQMLVHQTNCIIGGPNAVGAGLYTKMIEHYPYCNVYGRRKASKESFPKYDIASSKDRGVPGEINIDRPSNSNGPIVVGINGQYGIAQTGKKNFHKFVRCAQEYTTESHHMREGWFMEGLSKLKNYIISNDIKTVGFPYHIGCNLAGGKWENYLAMIQEFASNQDQFKVKIYKFE